MEDVIVKVVVGGVVGMDLEIVVEDHEGSPERGKNYRQKGKVEREIEEGEGIISEGINSQQQLEAGGMGPAPSMNHD